MTYVGKVGELVLPRTLVYGFIGRRDITPPLDLVTMPCSACLLIAETVCHSLSRLY
jgi:hypothetical protein